MPHNVSVVTMLAIIFSSVITINVCFFQKVIAENQDCQLLKADVYSVGALMFKVILFERPWKSKLNTARNMPCGGHREARKILQGVVSMTICCSQTRSDWRMKLFSIDTQSVN